MNPSPSQEMKMREPPLDHRWAVVLIPAGAENHSFLEVARGKDPGAAVASERLEASASREEAFERTLRRTAQLLPSSRTLVVLTESQQRICRDALAQIPPDNAIIQPRDKGSLPGILWSLLRLRNLDRRAVVAFFPSEQQYSPEEVFGVRIAEAFEVAELNPQFIVLLGAPADRLAADYGWILPKQSVLGNGGSLRPIAQFFEKPSTDEARDLLNRGCLWSTFVMVGSASSFLEIIEAAVPDLYRTFASILGKRQKANEAELVARFYGIAESWDFSTQVLSMNVSRLAVLGLGEVGWSDETPRKPTLKERFDSAAAAPIAK
ncbi:MAG TPA: sugar phosphate nucleotidyltransferase [Bryobacteraceae bacterium]|jgi:mannose-1-phosphate guanylyltransferase